MTTETVMTTAAEHTPVKIKKKSRAGETWRRFKKNKTAVFGLCLFIFIALICLLADAIVDYQVSLAQSVPEMFQSPNSEHWFGTDNYGRDIFARIIHGSRNSLLVGFGATITGITIGGLLGCICGFFGGKFDAIMTRILDAVMCIPMILLALAIVAVLGTSLINVMIGMMISSVPIYCRTTRAAVLGVAGQTYIEAARSCGTPSFRIILKHVVPNAIGPIIVQTTMAVGNSIISAAGISFIGMGIQPPTPEWGAMLSEAKNYFLLYPYMVIVPGIAIGLTALSMNLMGDGLRDALDPKLKD